MNIHLTASTNKKDFMDFRNGRDAKLNAPKLLLPSIQINMNGGHAPLKEENGTNFIKLPLTFK